MIYEVPYRVRVPAMVGGTLTNVVICETE